MNINEICGNIKEREIVLYGEQEEIYCFIERYQYVLNIKAVMTEHKKEVKLQAYADFGIKTILVENMILNTELIVICDKVKFGTLVKRLEGVGKTEYEGFISHELVDALIEKKSLMICMGTQLLEQVSRFFDYCPELKEKYSVIYYPENDIWERHTNRMPEYLHVCRWCDVYVHSSCEKERFSLKVFGKNELKSNCRIITVADYGFAGYFPQIIRDREDYSDFFLRQRERFDFSYETIAFARTDKEIEELCRKNEDVNKITEKLMKNNYFSAQSVSDYFVDELRRFSQLEKMDDIKLGDFIGQHKEEILCRNLNEWNEPVVSFVTEKVLQILGLPKLSIGIADRKKLIEENSGSEIPVYPSVKAALNLRGIENKQYRIVTYQSVKYMSEEEYIRFAVEYLYKAMELIQIMGIEEENVESK